MNMQRLCVCVYVCCVYPGVCVNVFAYLRVYGRVGSGGKGAGCCGLAWQPR
jgi:hypothetical protein